MKRVIFRWFWLLFGWRCYRLGEGQYLWCKGYSSKEAEKFVRAWHNEVSDTHTP